jgi:hypothetical protein
LNIIEAACDPNLFGPFFKDEQTWSAWRTFLKVLFGIPLDGGERQLFRECTGRQKPSKGGHNEAWLVIGRRGGKYLPAIHPASAIAALNGRTISPAPG